MKILQEITFITFILALFVGTSLRAEDYLDATAIKTLITGKTIYATHLKKDFKFKVYFDKDGKSAIRQQKGKNTETTYRFEGSKHCIHWKGKDRCANIVDNGDGTYSRVNNKSKRISRST